mmetsp:Transcript_16320/g.36718  ORF Transcript_16320/g.36718 Transcript_16320/m.36718 type:complete len:289 (-) Transcript_16320:7-873(-)
MHRRRVALRPHPPPPPRLRPPPLPRAAGRAHADAVLPRRPRRGGPPVAPGAAHPGRPRHHRAERAAPRSGLGRGIPLSGPELLAADAGGGVPRRRGRDGHAARRQRFLPRHGEDGRPDPGVPAQPRKPRAGRGGVRAHPEVRGGVRHLRALFREGGDGRDGPPLSGRGGEGGRKGPGEGGAHVDEGAGAVAGKLGGGDGGGVSADVSQSGPGELCHLRAAAGGVDGAGGVGAGVFAAHQVGQGEKMSFQAGDDRRGVCRGRLRFVGNGSLQIEKTFSSDNNRKKQVMC